MNKEMDYPLDFVNKVKSLYPEQHNLFHYLEIGAVFAGRLLDDYRYKSITPSEIIAAFDKGTEQELKSKAEYIIACNEVYREWSQLYDEQVGQA
jgi:hypothetical protein